MPPWLAGPTWFCLTRFTEKGRRLLGASHFSHSPEEMKRYYYDVLHTGEKLGVAMPHLSALREGIESSWPTISPPPGASAPPLPQSASRKTS
jgi:hypothetical protein